MVVAVIASYSRGAVIALLLFLGMFLVAFFVRQFTLPAYPQKKLIAGVLLAAFAVFAFIGLKGLNAQETWDRMEQLFDGKDNTVVVRQTATKATFDMWRGARWLGHGAGSFKLIFPQYQQHYPSIYEFHVTVKGKKVPRRFFWENAHNDIAQTLAEFGLVGTGLIALGMLWGLVRFVRIRAWANPISITLILGLIATLIHSWGEFVFQNPAILVTWAALGIISLRWSELELPPQSR